MTFPRITASTTAAALTLALLVGREGLAAAQALHPRLALAPVSAERSSGGRRPRPPVNYARLPMAFEARGGQKDRHNDFAAQGAGYRLALSPREATFQLARAATRPTVGRQGLQAENSPAQVETLKMQLVGANPSACAVQNAAPTGHTSYFIGKDPAQWRTGIPLYERVSYRQVYKGIDLVYYGNQHLLEYDFLVRPGTDPKRIALKFAGAQKVRIAPNGDLVLGLKQGEVRWHRPLTYQMIAGKKRTVASAFVLHSDGEVGFRLARYDTARALTIDPQLLYSTFLGGTTSEHAGALAVDSAGNTYITGTANSADFPTTPGVFQTTGHGAFVAKLNPAGTALLYSTHLGGSGNDTGNGIAIDSQGNAYITGETSSNDFPITQGAFQTTNKQATKNSGNAFVAKLNPTGTALIYSTYLGGQENIDGFDSGNGIAVDSQGNAYIAGVTNALDFPTTAGAFQTTSYYNDTAVNIRPNGFLSKLNPTGSALVYSTYLGGSSTTCYAIALDSAGDAYVTGGTSGHFPTTPGAFQETNTIPVGGGNNAFVTKFNPAGTALVYSTYLGGSKDDVGFGIALDGAGNAYVAGTAFSKNFPTTPGAFQPTRTAIADRNPNLFASKLNPTGSALVFSTYLGGSIEDDCTGLVLDSAGNMCLTGVTSSPDFPTTVGASQRTLKGKGGDGNAFVTRLNATGTALLYSTYLGGTSSVGGFAGAGDLAYGLAIDSFGNATVVGDTSSLDFPTTPNAFQRTFSAAATRSTAFVTRLSTHPIFPDFNNDGATDLLLQNSTTQQVAAWFMNGPTLQGSSGFSQTPPATYSLVGAGDFRGDGVTTLVFQDTVDNRVILWYTAGVNNAHISGGDYVSQTPGPGWKVVGVADFNHDGRSDLLFQNQTTGELALWFLKGPYYQGGLRLLNMPAAGWPVVGTGDFNGDGYPDIAFQNQTTGQIVIWFMNGPTFVDGDIVQTRPGAGWKVVGVGDYNGDGKADLLFQNQNTHQGAVWYMNGTLFQGGSLLFPGPPAGANIVGPR